MNAQAELEQSAADLVYETLRNRILGGVLKPGDILSELDLARTLNVSRTPVHDALRRLGSEGLIDMPPRRRARVALLTAEDIEQLYAIRGALEGLAAERAALRIDPEAMRTLEDATVRMEAIVREGAGGYLRDRIREFSDANKVFHLAVLRASADRWLNKTFGTVLDFTLGPITTVAAVPVVRPDEGPDDPFVRNCIQHREIIAALKARDANWAGTAMRLHVLSAQRDWNNSRETEGQD